MKGWDKRKRPVHPQEYSKNQSKYILVGSIYKCDILALGTIVRGWGVGGAVFRGGWDSEVDSSETAEVSTVGAGHQVQGWGWQVGWDTWAKIQGCHLAPSSPGWPVLGHLGGVHDDLQPGSNGWSDQTRGPLSLSSRGQGPPPNPFRLLPQISGDSEE